MKKDSARVGKPGNTRKQLVGNITSGNKNLAVMVRFLMDPEQVDTECPDWLPGCIAELRCDEEYMLNGGCKVRHICDRSAWELYGGRQ